jgi:hypothetical protein
MFFILFLLTSFQAVRLSPARVAVFSLAVSLATAAIFPYTNYCYKAMHYYPCSPLSIRAVFTNDIDRFALAKTARPDLYRLTLRAWQDWKKGVACEPSSLPAELQYIPIELGMVIGKSWSLGIPGLAEEAVAPRPPRNRPQR